MKYKNLAEATYVNDIEKRNEILGYVQQNTYPLKMYNNKFDIVLNAGIYEIHAEELHLHPDDEEFKYPIRYCDEFNLYGSKIKSFKNLPRAPYKFNTIMYRFDECNSLDFTGFDITSKVQNAILIKNTQNVNPNHLPRYSDHVRILNCTGDVLYDFQKYDMHYTNITLGLAAKLKNVPYVLKTRLTRCGLSLSSKYYTSTQLQALERVILDFIGRNNREEYIMDMTLELIAQGFEDET